MFIKKTYDGDYEAERMERYKGITQRVEYSADEIRVAYNEWRTIEMTPECGARKREPQWNIYCDMRDGMLLGTNRDIMLRKPEGESRGN